MTFPPHIANAPTPRTHKIMEFSTSMFCRENPQREAALERGLTHLERQLIWAEEVMEKLYSIRKSRPTVTEEGSSEDYWDCHIDATLTALNEYKQGTKEV